MTIPDLWGLQEPSQMPTLGAGGITWIDTDTKLTVDVMASQPTPPEIRDKALFLREVGYVRGG